MAYRIIDVSSNNGQLDWDTIKLSIDGVIIRIGYGSDIESQDDSQAIRNMQECERLGIPYGVYIYSYCLNIEEVRSEAAHILRMIQGFNPVLGVWFDMEDADGYKRNHGLVPEQNGELLTDFCIEFMQIVKDAGYTTGVYANYSYFTNVLNDGRLMSFEGFNRWLAHWGIDEPSMDCLLWQCTSDAVIDGSSARTDFNYYYGELPNVEPVIPSEPIEDNSESDDIKTKYHVGDYVSYHTIYASSTSENGLTPSITGVQLLISLHLQEIHILLTMVQAGLMMIVLLKIMKILLNQNLLMRKNLQVLLILLANMSHIQHSLLLQLPKNHLTHFIQMELLQLSLKVREIHISSRMAEVG